MACFQVTENQRLLLSTLINIGFATIPITDDNAEDLTALTDILEELDAGNSPVELTIMAVEKETTH
jgi:hypothetical protein